VRRGKALQPSSSTKRGGEGQNKTYQEEMPPSRVVTRKQQREPNSRKSELRLRRKNHPPVEPVFQQKFKGGGGNGNHLNMPPCSRGESAEGGNDRACIRQKARKNDSAVLTNAFNGRGAPKLTWVEEKKGGKRKSSKHEEGRLWRPESRKGKRSPTLIRKVTLDPPYCNKK